MKKRTELDVTGSVLAAIVQMAEGNPGAATALAEAFKADQQRGFMTMLHLDDMDMRGPQIWIAYNDVCDRDVNAFMDKVLNRDAEMIAAVNAHAGVGRETPRAVESGASFRR